MRATEIFFIRSLFVGLAAFVCFIATTSGSAAAPDSDGVVILANASDPESLELAHYYADRRGVPVDRILALPMSSAEEISWPEFITTLWNPLLRAGLINGWIEGAFSRKTDNLGRLKIAATGHSIEALVVCRGVPLRVAHDAALIDESSTPLNKTPAYRTNEGAVDSELALLTLSGAPLDGFIPNPLFEQEHPDEKQLAQVIPVGRLDGPALADAKGLVDRALAAERDGLCGRAYLDLGGGPVQQGNDWFASVVPALAPLGFELDIDRDSKTLPPTARFDAPVLYFGWYEWNVTGPFLAPDFRFPTGAIALHLHSFSAGTLRSADKNWAGPFVARGVTATVGNVGEPYLEFTHQPHLFARALVRGEPLARAALYSIRALSWKGVVIGDPLYRPFALDDDAQWARRASLPPAAEPYARIRRMRLLAAAGDQAGALGLGQSGMMRNPSLPLALTLADLQLASSDAPAARRTLGVFAALPKWRDSDRPLMLAAAQTLGRAADAPAACRLLQRLLADASLPAEFRIPALRQAIELARTARDPSLVSKWQGELTALTAPPTP
jgi:uncharacterized protein (TIGR03790 family)